MSPVTRILILILAVVGGMLYKQVSELLSDAQMPYVPLNQWWGDKPEPEDWKAYLANTSQVVSNKLFYPDETIEDLKAQLSRNLHLTEPLAGANFEYGFNTKELQKIIKYWRDDYLPRWRERELFLWQFNHLTTEIQGLRLHFLHLAAYDENTVGKHHYPVLLLHGWPGSIREFYDLIHKLYEIENNEYVFDVIVPSLPGYAWSQGTSKAGLGPAQMAVIIRNLMNRLGYKKYFVQGGDGGSAIGSHIATLFPDEVLGYHSNLCTALTPKSMVKGFIASIFPTYFVPQDYENFFFPLAEKFKFIMEESGYMHLQSTKPDTIGTVLQNNPVGLAAYILEKFSTWTNSSYRHLAHGGLKKRFKIDALLDNIMIYYLTDSITTSQRIYKEHYTAEQRRLKLERVPTNVPTGCARFKNDLIHFMDFQLKDKYTNLIHSTYYKTGGHFSALELPNTLYNDFIDFVKKVEKVTKISNYKREL